MIRITDNLVIFSIAIGNIHGILRFHCHVINTAQKNKLETTQRKKPRNRLQKTNI